jgi:undecaprenyl diphosphate synthase
MDDPRIPDRNRKHMAEAEELTAGNRVLNLVFAFNYGSQREIAEAAREVARKAKQGEIDPEAITEETIADHLYIPDMPPVDLVIRSSGEHRLSNFLLWQSAYAEFYFPGILWPDFDRHALVDAVVEYQARERRFGGAEDRIQVD